MSPRTWEAMESKAAFSLCFSLAICNAMLFPVIPEFWTLSSLISEHLVTNLLACGV